MSADSQTDPTQNPAEVLCAPALQSLIESIAKTSIPEELLRLALTHPSAVGEGLERTLKSNQRLEFLGDTILGATIADALYRTQSELPEGELTQRRAAVVQKSTLARVARRLELGQWLILGRGESNSGGHARDTILADVVEALIAAVFLSGGWEAAQRWVLHIFADEIEAAGRDAVNIKNRLQEWTQANGLGTPKYETGEIAAAGQQRFSSQVVLGDTIYGHGRGGTKKEAECVAAAQTLNVLLNEPQSVTPSESGEASILTESSVPPVGETAV
ncbi:MAG: ribonuclease [Abditibacteriota bacterium]|nr:ribonuclease [Abditibacteriota bacterium]